MFTKMDFVDIFGESFLRFFVSGFLFFFFFRKGKVTESNMEAQSSSILFQQSSGAFTLSKTDAVLIMEEGEHMWQFPDT